MFPLARFRIEDDSMRPTLSPGDYVLVNTWAYAFRGPSEGDLIVLRHPEAQDKYIIKRVASVRADGGLMVVGDNRERSRDSRHFGPVGRNQIVGKVWLRAKA